MNASRLLAAVASAAVVVTAVACAPPEKKSGGEQTNSGVAAAQATSAADFGGTASTIRLEMVGNGIRVNDHAFGKLSDPTKPKIMTSIGSTLSRAI